MKLLKLFVIIFQLMIPQAFGQTRVNSAVPASRVFDTVLLVKGKHIPAVISIGEQTLAIQGANASEFPEVSAAYGSVRFVRIFRANDPSSDQLFHVLVGLDDGNIINARFDMETDAKALADSIGVLTKLKPINGSYYRPKTFNCPEIKSTGCVEFKELFDHDDAEISDYFYSKGVNEPSFACFGDHTFFIVVYSRPPGKDRGAFIYKKFEGGQSSEQFYGSIAWTDGLGRISSLPLQRSMPAGYISENDLSLFREFHDQAGAVTTDEVTVEWSTLNYKETIKSNDEHGKPASTELTGSCVKISADQ